MVLLSKHSQTPCNKMSEREWYKFKLNCFYTNGINIIIILLRLGMMIRYNVNYNESSMGDEGKSRR